MVCLLSSSLERSFHRWPYPGASTVLI